MAEPTRSLAAGVRISLLSLGLLAGCSDGAEKAAQDGAPSLIVSTSPAGFPKGTNRDRAPADNALSLERALLGKRLFYDPQLSRTNDVSCGTCHQQQYAFADPSAISTGVDGRTGTRNAPSIVNAPVPVGAPENRIEDSVSRSPKFTRTPTLT